MLTALILAAATAASPVPASAPVEKAVQGFLSFTGTEPFWGFDIQPGDGAVFSEPGEEGTVYTEVGPMMFQPGEDGVWSFSGYGYKGTISAASCSDGMSDTAYPYMVTLDLLVPPARNLKGCGYRSWGQDVVAAMPVIDACYAAGAFANKPPEVSPPPVAFAAASGPRDGYVLFFGQEEDVPYTECAVTGGTATLGAFKSEAGPPGTAREIFVRKTGVAGEVQPGGQCYDAGEVKSEAGEMLGWWMDPMGC
jgi:uncharacterized membrane protein